MSGVNPRLRISSVYVTAWPERAPPFWLAGDRLIPNGADMVTIWGLPVKLWPWAEWAARPSLVFVSPGPRPAPVEIGTVRLTVTPPGARPALPSGPSLGTLVGDNTVGTVQITLLPTCAPPEPAETKVVLAGIGSVI